MSIHIRTNLSSTARSLSEQGAFSNSMYQREEEKKNKKSNDEPIKKIHEDVSDQFNKNDKKRMKSAGLNSEISNIEEEISIAQTVERALTITEESLIQMRELVDLIDNENEFNSDLRNADQLELEKLVNRINKISDETSYGNNNLLDGSHGIRGVANGKYLEFVNMNPNPNFSPLSGYEIEVFEVATRPELKGRIPLTQEVVNNSEGIIFEVDDIVSCFDFRKGETVSRTLRRLSKWILETGIPIEKIENKEQVLHFRHLQYGSSHGFGESRLIPRIIQGNNNILFIKPGNDIKGSINGILCSGNGQFLSTPEDAKEIGRLTIRYTGNEVPKGKKAGFVSVSQNGFQFLKGSSDSFFGKLCLKSIHSSNLGKQTENISGFESLKDIDIKSSQRVKDSLSVIKKSLEEVAEVKDRVELICDKKLKGNIQNLKQEHCDLHQSNQNIQNSGNARVIAEITKNKITENSDRSSIAQAYQNPNAVLTLLK